ncbi:MAG TPA: hypothetical protein VJS43_03305 [Candidatus Acidoferrales bacterium]|nr:hypothetical protein [Candidatus Acidoferrales bacterium]
MRIAMDVSDRLTERDRFRAQREKEILEAVWSAIGFSKGLRIAQRASLRRILGETGIGLRENHDGPRMPLVGFLDRLLHPGNDGVSQMAIKD